MIMETLIFFFSPAGVWRAHDSDSLSFPFLDRDSGGYQRRQPAIGGRCYHSNPAKLLLLATGETSSF